MIQDLLKTCGYPESILVLDAETYFDKDYSLKKLSTYEYVSDKRFEILGWASKRNDEPAEFHMELSKHTQWNQTTIIMHHAPFDALILAHHYKIFPPFIIDTLDLARHIEPRWSNKLADLAKRHGLPPKGDTNQFKEMHQNGCTAQQWVNLINYATNDADLEYELFKLLLPKLSNPKFELEVARYTRDLFIRPVLRLNMGRAERLKEQMQIKVVEALDRVDMTETQVRSEEKFKARLQSALDPENQLPKLEVEYKTYCIGEFEEYDPIDDTREARDIRIARIAELKPLIAERTLPMKQGKLKPLLAIAKTDPGYSYLLNHPNDQVRQLMEARVAAKSWPLHIKRVQRLQTIYNCANNRLPIPLRYYGAHTGRWSGGEGLNPQNLTARGHPLANQVRTLIEAPFKHALIIADFSQIEARVLDWLAEQHDMLQAFAEGRQIYSEFASKLTGYKIRKPKKTDSKVVADWYGNYRQMGKIGILGAGYGMGVDKCISFAKNTYGIDLDYAAAEKLIKLYRKTHAMVVQFWYKIEKTFIRATQNPGQTYELSYNLRFFRENNATVIQLPSIRRLYYTGAKIEGTTRYPQIVMPNPARHGVRTIRMWGGHLAENIVQAVSRDILAETVFKVEALGVRVPLIVHDDLSVVVPEKEAKVYQTQIEDIARTPPIWAPGLPIDIECRISKEYCK